MKIIKVYDDNFIGKKLREKAERKLFFDGYKIESEEEIKEFSGRMACCLAIVFLPLALLALVIKVKKIKVVYSK